MENIIDKIFSTDNLALLFTVLAVGYLLKENVETRKEIKELRLELQNNAKELGFLKGKTELAESIGKKLDKIEMILATKNPSN